MLTKEEGRRYTSTREHKQHVSYNKSYAIHRYEYADYTVRPVSYTVVIPEGILHSFNNLRSVLCILYDPMSGISFAYIRKIFTSA